MKAILIFSILAAISAQAPARVIHLPQAQSQVVDYRVSKVGADKTELMKVFEAVQKLEKPAGKDVENFTVHQRIDSRNFIAYKMKQMGHAAVTDGLGGVGGGGGVSPIWYEEVVDYSRLYWLTTIQPMNVADGEMIKGVPFTETPEVRQAQGSSYRVLVETRQDPANEFTKEKFVESLKAGKTWLLKGFTNKPCNSCGGQGYHLSVQGNVVCPDCGGKGAIVIDYLVKW